MPESRSCSVSNIRYPYGPNAKITRRRNAIYAGTVVGKPPQMLIGLFPLLGAVRQCFDNFQRQFRMRFGGPPQRIDRGHEVGLSQRVDGPADDESVFVLEQIDHRHVDLRDFGPRAVSVARNRLPQRLGGFGPHAPARMVQQRQQRLSCRSLRRLSGRHDGHGTVLFTSDRLAESFANLSK